MCFMMSFDLLVKLHHSFLLSASFYGATTDSTDLINSVDPTDFPHLHQIACQHCAGPPMTVHAVDSNPLRKKITGL